MVYTQKEIAAMTPEIYAALTLEEKKAYRRAILREDFIEEQIIE